MKAKIKRTKKPLKTKGIRNTSVVEAPDVSTPLTVRVNEAAYFVYRWERRPRRQINVETDTPADVDTHIVWNCLARSAKGDMSRITIGVPTLWRFQIADDDVPVSFCRGSDAAYGAVKSGVLFSSGQLVPDGVGGQLVCSSRPATIDEIAGVRTTMHHESTPGAEVSEDGDAVILGGHRRALTRQQQLVLAYYRKHRRDALYIRDACRACKYRATINTKMSVVFRDAGVRNALFVQEKSGKELWRLRLGVHFSKP